MGGRGGERGGGAAGKDEGLVDGRLGGGRKLPCSMQHHRSCRAADLVRACLCGGALGDNPATRAPDRGRGLPKTQRSGPHTDRFLGDGVEDRISRSARPPKILDCLPVSNCYCTQEAANAGCILPRRRRAQNRHCFPSKSTRRHQDPGFSRILGLKNLVIQESFPVERRAASAAPARTRTTPRCGRRLGVRPTGGPCPIGRRGGRCVPVAAARWGGGVPTLRRRRPSRRPPQATPTRAHAKTQRGKPASEGENHWQRGSGSGVPQPRPGATPSGEGGKASGGTAVGDPTARHRGRPWRRPPAGLRRGSRARPPTPRRRGENAAVASATALMGTPVDAAATAVAAVAAGRGGWSATSPSGGRAAPRAKPPRWPLRDERWRLPRRRRRRARALPPRGIRTPRPPRPPRPPPRRPWPRPPLAAA